MGTRIIPKLAINQRDVWNTPHMYIYIYILVGGWATPLKNMTSSIGMMRFPILMGTCQKWQPNHQPDIYELNKIEVHHLMKPQ